MDEKNKVPLEISYESSLWSYNAKINLRIDKQRFKVPHGYRGNVLLMLLSHLSFKLRGWNRFYTELEPSLAELLKGFCRLSGASRISAKKLQELEKMSFEDLVEWLRVYVLSRVVRSTCIG